MLSLRDILKCEVRRTHVSRTISRRLEERRHFQITDLFKVLAVPRGLLVRLTRKLCRVGERVNAHSAHRRIWISPDANCIYLCLLILARHSRDRFGYELRHLVLVTLAIELRRNTPW